jgi:nitrate/TMAO reductase-like tetraheme cytochrome c subunit
MSREARRILSYYSQPLGKEAAPGHQIIQSVKQRNDFAQAKLKQGDKLPCYDCHNVHGSRGTDGVRPNAKLISDQRAGFWYGLTNTISDAAQNRRFCFGCHVEADGVPFSREVEGIKMNRLPDVPEHRAASTKSCYDCHASPTPYETDTSFNVHYVRFAP